MSRPTRTQLLEEQLQISRQAGHCQAASARSSSTFEPNRFHRHGPQNWRGHVEQEALSSTTFCLGRGGKACERQQPNDTPNNAQRARLHQWQLLQSHVWEPRACVPPMFLQYIRDASSPVYGASAGAAQRSRLPSCSSVYASTTLASRGVSCVEGGELLLRTRSSLAPLGCWPGAGQSGPTSSSVRRRQRARLPVTKPVEKSSVHSPLFVSVFPLT